MAKSLTHSLIASKSHNLPIKEYLGGEIPPADDCTCRDLDQTFTPTLAKPPDAVPAMVKRWRATRRAAQLNLIGLGARMPSASRIPHRTLAARVHRFGGPETIVVEEIAVGAFARGEVLVRVEACGVGPWDDWVRRGDSPINQPLPLTLGAEIAGVVVATGGDTGAFAIGDAVFGVTNSDFTGGYAGYAACQVDRIARKPSTLSFAEAAATPVAATMACSMLFDSARLASGQSVLVHGATSLVGRHVVELARYFGIKLSATARQGEEAALKHCGVEDFVRLGQGGQTFDAALDFLGRNSQALLLNHLVSGSRLVTAVDPPDCVSAIERGVQAQLASTKVCAASLEVAARLLDAGVLVPRLGSIFSLADACLAHRLLASPSKPEGKLILIPGVDRPR
jgi:NADPH:quinone reductase-like Zn-dependent oxidoreductase